MDTVDWQQQIVATINRGLGQAIDVAVAREASRIPGWTPNANQTTPGGALQTGIQTTGAQLAGLLPVVLLIAGVVIAVKLSR